MKGLGFKPALMLLLLGSCANPAWVAPEATPPLKPVASVRVLPMPLPTSTVVFEVGTTPNFKLRLQGKWQTLKNQEDFWLQSPVRKATVNLVHSDWVFVGYGLTLPALGWDNYRALDVVGKTVVVLPGSPAINNGAVVDSRTLIMHPVARNFGQWQQKLRNAREHGAAMVLMVHEGSKEDWLKLMEFPNAIVGNVDEFALLAWGWLPEARFKGWLNRTGVNWERLRARAQATDFAGVVLPLQTDLNLQNHWHEIEVPVGGAGGSY
jgi:hypothetical protein